MQLAGRLLLVIMFVTIIRFELTFTSTLQNLIGAICILFVAIGFKTKLSALFLVIFLSIANIYANCFWRVQGHRALHDFLKYDFFQQCRLLVVYFLLLHLVPVVYRLMQERKNGRYKKQFKITF